MEMRLHRIAFGIALFACVASPSVAFAQGGEGEARSRYSKGLELYNDGAFSAALAEFERAYQLSPHYKVLYSIGLVKQQLSDFVGAYRAFQEYLAAAADETPQRKQEVKERIDQLRERVGTLDVKSGAAGSEIFVNDQLVGTAPLAQPLLVNPGRHTVYAKKGNTRSDVKNVLVAGGETQRIALEVSQEAAPARQPDPVFSANSQSESPKSSVSGLAVAGWITTGVLAAGAVTTGILTMTSRSDLEDAQKRPNSGADLDSKASNVQTLALVTDILGAAALVTGGVSLYLTLKGPSKAAPERQATWVRFAPGAISVGRAF